MATKKQQIIDSINQFIDENKKSYNGIIPMNDIEYSVNGNCFAYESPFHRGYYYD